MLRRSIFKGLLAQLKPTVTFTLLLTITLTLLSACRPAPDPARVEVRLMETTDLHAYMLGYDYFNQQPTADYGLAHTAALIHQARAEQPNSLLFDNGDLIQGSALGDWAARLGAEAFAETVHPVIKALNYLQYDAANLGNHEFNFGLEFMEATLAGANFPYVSANVFYADRAEQAGMRTEGWGKPIVDPYVILEREMRDQYGKAHVLKIGVIGFLPPQIMVWDAAHLSERVYVRDIVAAAQYYVPQMRDQGADIVVAIPHSGLSDYSRYAEFTEQATRSIATVPGIDAILFGHQHRLFPGDPSYDDVPHVDNERGLIHGVPAVQPGYWGNHLGVIDLVLERQYGAWKVIDSDVALRAVTEAYDQTLVELLAEQHQATLEMLNESLAELATPINSFFARLFPDSSTAFINDAQVWYARTLQSQGVLPEDLPILSAAAPFRNGFQNASDYTHIAAGEITLGDLAALYVYPNTLQVVKVSGATLREWLEMSAIAFRTIDPTESAPQDFLSTVPAYNFDVFSGIRYRIDPTQPPRYNRAGERMAESSGRILELNFQGEPIEPEQQFLVVTNNYRASGGGNFPGLSPDVLIHDSGEEVRQIIANYALYMAEKEGMLQINERADWALKLPADVSLKVRSSDHRDAEEEALRLNGLHKLDQVENGYRFYEFRPRAN